MPVEMSQMNLIGLTFSGADPVGRQHIRTDPGVTAIYGKNGVGKSRLLEGLSNMLEHRSSIWNNYDDGPPPTPNRLTAPHPAQAMYLSGYHAQLEPVGSLESSLFWVVDLTGDMDGPLPTADDDRRLIADLLPAEAPPESAEYLLDRGVVWICDGHALAYICDPDPKTSPLADLWNESQEEWRKNLTQLTTDQLEQEELQEHTGEGGSYFTFPGGWRFELRRRLEHGFESVTPPALPLLPSTIGINDWPTWAAAPVAFTGRNRLKLGSLGEREFDLTAATLGFLPYGFDWSPPRTNADVIWPNRKPTGDAAKRLEQSAQKLLNKLFDEPPLLKLTVTHPSEWFRGREAIRWSASSSPDRPGVPLNALGSAHARYSQFAIQRALSMTKSQQTDATSAAEPAHNSILIVDEPERALHQLAEGTVAKGLASLAEVVIVATHSAEILDQADNLLHAVENGLGLRLAPLQLDLSAEQRRWNASRLGLTPSGLAGLTRVLVFVEGQHDKVVIEEFLADELRKARTEVIPMGGTYGIDSIAAAGYIVSATDAPMIICVDNASNQDFQNLYKRLRNASSSDEGNMVLNTTRTQRHWSSSDEAKRLHAVVTTTWNFGQISRIRPFAFGERDIARYFEPKDLGLDFDDWDAVWRAYTALQESTSGVYTGSGFKKWARRNGAAYHTDGLQQLAARYAIPWRAGGDAATTRPKDFNDLADLILDASTMSRNW